jgi:AcrR family transcriptional regulator
MQRADLSQAPAPAPVESGEREPDGRRRRSADSRRRIVEAMLDLVREGHVAPSAELVAARAGVGRRTVFRLFRDMEGIYRGMNAAMRAKVAPLRALPLAGATAADRLQALAERRIRFFEEVMLLTVASAVHRHGSAVLQADHSAMQAELRAILMAVLDEARAEGGRPDDETREALDAVLSIDFWRRLRLEQRLERDAATAIVQRLTRLLLAPV